MGPKDIEAFAWEATREVNEMWSNWGVQPPRYLTDEEVENFQKMLRDFFAKITTV